MTARDLGTWPTSSKYKVERSSTSQTLHLLQLYSCTGGAVQFPGRFQSSLRRELSSEWPACRASAPRAPQEPDTDSFSAMGAASSKTAGKNAQCTPCESKRAEELMQKVLKGIRPDKKNSRAAPERLHKPGESHARFQENARGAVGDVAGHDEVHAITTRLMPTMSR